MSEVTMTLYEALSKKKVLEKQVENLKSYRLVDIKKTNFEESLSGENIEDVKKSIQAGYDKSVAVFNNYVELKAAINEANARIIVTIAGQNYTIANAIIRQRMLDDEELMYNRMLANIASLENEIEKNNNKYLSPDAIAAYIKNVLGDSKKDENLINSMKEDYIKSRTIELYDPLKTKEVAERKLEEIALFREQIHYALTQANCNNSITVNFAD